MILVCMLGGLGLAAGDTVPGASPERTQYQGIVDRNVFGLKPPNLETNEAPPAIPPPKITLTGITTILGDKRVLFEIEVPGKPPDQHMMVAGQREADVEVLEIDENSGTVKVNNHGTMQTLDFKDNGANAQTASLSGRPINPALAGARNPGELPAGMRTIPRRTLRLPPTPGWRPNSAWHRGGGKGE